METRRLKKKILIYRGSENFVNKIPKDIDKWDNNKWTQQVVNCRPSSGGAVGVVFVWAGMALSRQNMNEAKMAAFVIKPIQGTAAPTKFAEHLLSRIAGAHSPNSKPIARRSPSGSGLMLTLKMFRSREADPVTKARWNEVFMYYDRADAFLIQETQIGIKEFGDVAVEQSGLAMMLSDQQLMINLGRMFAVDALLGNGDRVSGMNSGNIIFQADGTLCSIDSTTVLTEYQSVLNQQGMSAKKWITNDLEKGSDTVMSPGQVRQNDINMSLDSPHDPRFKPVATAPGAGLQMIYDVDTWWREMFVHAASLALVNRVDKNTNQPLPDLPIPPDTVWEQAKVWFKQGVDAGIRDIDSQLTVLNWLLVKNSYFRFTQKYGGDPNLDWTNFKLRRRYIKLRNRKYTHDQALVDIKDYAARKFPGL